MLFPAMGKFGRRDACSLRSPLAWPLWNYGGSCWFFGNILPLARRHIHPSEKKGTGRSLYQTSSAGSNCNMLRDASEKQGTGFQYRR